MQPKIKISKQLAGFMEPRTIRQKDKQPNQPKNPRTKTAKDEEPKIDNPPSKKKSRNPFQPIHQWIKFSKEIDAKISEARQGIEMDRLSKLSFEKNSDIYTKKQQLRENIEAEGIKYEECLTLQVIKKNQNYCFKKILHVPTLTLYYLRESVIDFHIDKHQLEEWIKNCNKQADQQGVGCLRILKLYWNMPQSYYSLLYQYGDGIMLATAFQNMNSLPLSTIKWMTNTYLNSPPQIFNSQIIISRNDDNKTWYMPVYEEIDDLIHHQRDFRRAMKIQNEQNNRDKVSQQAKTVAKIGFFVLLGYFGETIVDEDVSCLFFEKEDQCCLIHRLLDNPSSLISLYLSVNMNKKQEQNLQLIDFLCKCLKFKASNRSSLQQIQRHRFLKQSPQADLVTISEVIRSLEDGGKKGRNQISRELSQHKMNRILQSISGILQGAKQNRAQIDFSSQNPNIQYLGREFGLSNIGPGYSELASRLKKIFSGQYSS